jgi:hypothetical protein
MRVAIGRLRLHPPAIRFQSGFIRFCHLRTRSSRDSPCSTNRSCPPPGFGTRRIFGQRHAHVNGAAAMARPRQLYFEPPHRKLVHKFLVNRWPWRHRSFDVLGIPAPFALERVPARRPPKAVPTSVAIGSSLTDFRSNEIPRILAPAIFSFDGPLIRCMPCGCSESCSRTWPRLLHRITARTHAILSGRRPWEIPRMIASPDILDPGIGISRVFRKPFVLGRRGSRGQCRTARPKSAITGISLGSDPTGGVTGNRLPFDSQYAFPTLTYGSSRCHSCRKLKYLATVRHAHNPKVEGSNPSPATKPICYPAVATFTYLALRGIGTGHDLLLFHFKWILNRESLDLLPVLEIFRV